MGQVMRVVLPCVAIPTSCLTHPSTLLELYSPYVTDLFLRCLSFTTDQDLTKFSVSIDTPTLLSDTSADNVDMVYNIRPAEAPPMIQAAREELKKQENNGVCPRASAFALPQC